MTSKRSQPPGRESANLDADQIKRAIPRLEKRIADLETFDPSKLQERGAPEIVALRASIEQTLSDIFGHNSIEFHRYRSAAALDGGPMSLAGTWGRQTGSDYQFRKYYDQSRHRSIALLSQAIAGLKECAAELDEIPVENYVALDAGQGPSHDRRAFIVHGHEDGPKEAVARFMTKIGFEPIILHERPNKGRPLITKLREEAKEVGFAIVLMTPDDVGGKAGDQQKPRARQNVIFELGFFIAALGPERVAAIILGEVERPSDYDGVAYISYEADWKTQLAKELEAADFEIDWNKAMRP